MTAPARLPALLPLPALNAELVLLSRIQPPHRYGAHSDAAKAMRLLGQTGTVLLRPAPADREGRDLEVVDGARRVQSAMEREETAVLAIVRPTDDYGAALSTLSMNLTSGDNPVAQAMALKRAEEAGATLERVAADTGIRLGTLKRVRALAALPTDVLLMAESERVSPGTLGRIAGLPPHQQARAVLMLRGMKGDERFTAQHLSECRQVKAQETVIALDAMLSVQPIMLIDPVDAAAAQVRSLAKAQGISLTTLLQRLSES